MPILQVKKPLQRDFLLFGIIVSGIYVSLNKRWKSGIVVSKFYFREGGKKKADTLLWAYRLSGDLNRKELIQKPPSNTSGNFLVKFYRCCIGTNFFDWFFEDNDFPVNNKAGFFDGFGNLDRTNCTKDFTRSACFGAPIVRVPSAAIFSLSSTALFLICSNLCARWRLSSASIFLADSLAITAFFVGIR